MCRMSDIVMMARRMMSSSVQVRAAAAVPAKIPQISLFRSYRPTLKLQAHMGKKRQQRHRDLVYPMSDYESDCEGMIYGGGASYGSLGSTISFTSRRQEPTKIVPRNERQAAYLSMLETVDPPIIVAVGPAGVAKTYLCTAVGIQKLLSGAVSRLVITRPAVSVDEQHGFLPGTLEDKMDPWMRPIYDVFHKYVSPSYLKDLIAKGKIEICPLAYMRGRTFDDAFICADEMQNSTVSQYLMLLTRIGTGSKLVITGDPDQHDRGFAVNGLNDFLRRMDDCIDEKTTDNLRIVQFTNDDVERHPVIKHIINLYK